MPLDEQLFADLQKSLLFHHSLTLDVPNDAKGKFSMASPREVDSAIDRLYTINDCSKTLIEQEKMMKDGAVPSKRIVQDITLWWDYARKVHLACGHPFGDRKRSTGRRNKYTPPVSTNQGGKREANKHMKVSLYIHPDAMPATNALAKQLQNYYENLPEEDEQEDEEEDKQFVPTDLFNARELEINGEEDFEDDEDRNRIISEQTAAWGSGRIRMSGDDDN